MKRIAKSLVVVGAMLAAGSAAADMMDDVRPYIGLDYYQAWMKGGKVKGLPSGATFDFATEAPKSYPGATLYVGAKFMEYVGVELGADWSKRKSKTVSEIFEVGGVDVPGRLKTQIKRTGIHADVVGFLPVNDCFEILGFVGLGSVKAKTTQTASGTGFNLIGTYKNKAKTVARLGFGASYMVTEMIGLRAKLGWENTKRLKLQESTSPADTLKPFKDTISFSLGAFVRW